MLKVTTQEYHAALQVLEQREAYIGGLRKLAITHHESRVHDVVHHLDVACSDYPSVWLTQISWTLQEAGFLDNLINAEEWDPPAHEAGYSVILRDGDGRLQVEHGKQESAEGYVIPPMPAVVALFIAEVFESDVHTAFEAHKMER